MRARTFSGSSSFLVCSLALSGSRCPRAHWPSSRDLGGLAVLVGSVMRDAPHIKELAFELRETTGELDRRRRSGGQLGYRCCLLYTSPSPRDGLLSRMPSSA